ncbi:unnamed protein product [Rotaria sp. Silwood2]|nr:unnamed protein product [Rotaria sp. Silwood2]CAF3010887.1 unnamed protein product [Rotaria sp. Silwood2]CAF3904700.1 unnamed protein product [Rotaria sp. Silwood2]CAF4249284.1 unnamed protein product [Rotaria sp. Silwood2]
MRKRDDSDDNHIRTSPISSSSVPTTQPIAEQQKQILSNNVKLDLSPPLSQMTVNDICDCLKNDVIGLKPTMIPIYIQDINENNISGRVLITCELDELKQILSMTFGDWVLFSNWVRTKREEEQRSRFHLQSQYTPSTSNNDHRNLSNDDPFNEYEFHSENGVFSAALNRLFSNTLPNKTSNSTDEVLVYDNNKVSFVSVPKNVTFLIPSGLSGITSNDSTFSAIESTIRTTTHIKDIFPVKASSESQSITKDETDMVTSSSSPNSVTNTLLFDKENEQEIIKSVNEESHLLMNDYFNDK